MGKFILKRILLSIVILFCVMLIIYTLMHSLPTNYIDTMAQQLAQRPGGNKSAAGAQIKNISLRDAVNKLFAAIDEYMDTE